MRDESNCGNLQGLHILAGKENELESNVKCSLEINVHSSATVTFELEVCEL